MAKAKKAAAPVSPPPGDLAALAEAFFELFRGLDRAHGVYEIPQGRPGGGGGKKGKVEGRAATIQAPPTAELWEAHLAGERGLGIVPITDDATCNFGAIDVDKYGTEAIPLEEMEARVASFKLPLLPTRTKSGGIHLYIFTRTPLPAELIRARLTEWAVALGFGGSEIFPKQSHLLTGADTGNWINMPYFGGANGDTVRYGIFKGKPLSAVEYLERANRIKVTELMLEKLELPEQEDFINGPPCLQSLARSGFPQGMRNNGLFAVGVYLKKRYPDEWAAYLRDYNQKFFKPPLVHAEVETVIKALTRKEYNYTCDKPPCSTACNRTLCRTREFGIGKGEDDWQITIDSDALKIMTDPPYWIITVNGHRMAFFAEELMNQRDFQSACVSRFGFWPPSLKADKYRAEINKMLQSAMEVEAPADAGVSGQFEYHLQQFCTVFPQAETKEEILTGKPYIEDAIVHFRGDDFRMYLESKRVHGFEGAKLFKQAKQFGVAHKQMWIASRNVQVWTVRQPQAVNTEEVKARTAREGEM
jgi:hypothetical protein